MAAECGQTIVAGMGGVAGLLSGDRLWSGRRIGEGRFLLRDRRDQRLFGYTGFDQSNSNRATGKTFSP